MSHGVWQLTVRGDFAAAHALRCYHGKCENLHGHNYTVEIVVEGEELLPGAEYLCDFTELKVLLKEMVAFFVARIVSLGIDMAGMYLLLEIFKFGKMPAKIIVNVIVIVANYVFSKLFVFKKNGEVKNEKR